MNLNAHAIGHGVKTVAAAATAECLVSSSTPCRWVIVQAQTDNGGVVAVGGEGVLATVATGTGIALAAGVSVLLYVQNLNDVWVDATVNGEGVRYTYGLVE